MGYMNIVSTCRRPNPKHAPIAFAMLHPHPQPWAINSMPVIIYVQASFWASFVTQIVKLSSHIDHN